MRESTPGGFTPAKKQTVALATAIALALLLVLVAMVVLVPSRPAHAAHTDRLPDLRMAKFRHLQVQTTTDGRRLLRFSSIILNKGVGRFEAHGQRPDAGIPTMTVRQRIYNDAGGYRGVPTDAVMYYSGDGHNHWHVRNLERFSLTRLDNGVKVGTGAKHGFCFYDNFRAGSTQDPFYTLAGGACGSSYSNLRVRMGLSVGWGDIYHYTLPDQYIDITGLTAGNYRLRGVADPSNWFLETSNSNNISWADLKITSNGVTVVNEGTST